MTPAEKNPFLVNMVKEKDMESILDWFDQQDNSFYTFGWSYLKNQQDMEEVFHRTIVKTYDELHHFKKGTSFEIWATAIFIDICRDLSGKNQEKSGLASEEPQIFSALDGIAELDKEAIALIYFKKCSLDEAAHILQISTDEVKSRLFSGVQSLKAEMECSSGFESCKEYHQYYIDYFSRTLNRPEKIEFEIHIYHCPACQEELASFQDVMFTLTKVTDAFTLPSGFMEKVKKRVTETEKLRKEKQRKRKTKGLAFAGILALIMLTGFVTNGFANIYYSWVDWRNHEDEQLRAFLKNDLGERLNIEDVSNNVKIKIKSVIADDIQTLVYYEIEDIKEENRYMMNFYEGIKIENEYEIMSGAAPTMYFPPVDQSENEEKNIYKGKISLPPILSDDGTIELRITQLQKLVGDPSNPIGSGMEIEHFEGDWRFDLPVTKHPSIVHKLNTKTKIDGIPIRLEKLTLAPTATLLQYSYQNNQTDKHIEMINFASLETKEKKVQAIPYMGNIFVSENSGWTTLETSFETLYFDEPKEVQVQFSSIHLLIEDHEIFDIDVSKDFPQTIQYAGSNITIDEVKIANPAKVIITNELTEDRVYESLHLRITSKNEQGNISMGMSVEGVLVDRNGKKYKTNVYQFQIDQTDPPRYFQTKQIIELFNDANSEKIIPEKMEIEGYNTTKYVDDTVNVSLD